jgi:hypothetical protein
MDDEEDEILRWEPEPGEDITVLREQFCDLFGGCEQCPGCTKVAELRKIGEVNKTLEANQTVFCVHWCHKVAPEM